MNDRNEDITVSAPGKLMLFGEHAVVHGRPCIVTSVDQRLKIKVKRLDEPQFELEAPDVDVVNYKKALSDVGQSDIPKGAKFVEVATENFLGSLLLGNDIFTSHHPGKQSFALRTKSTKPAFGVKFETISQFKSTFGFGSSSASTVCTVKALDELFQTNLSDKEIFDICYKTVIDIQGVGSGFDLAAAIFGGTLYYISPGKVIKPLDINNLPLIVGYTGIKADTATLVKMVNRKMEKNPKYLSGIFDNIENIVLEAKDALVSGNFKKSGELMNLNHGQLEKLGVSSPKLDHLIHSARKAGAYGAKLSGAGGGDCMIALASEDKRKNIEDAIEKAGGQVLKVEVNKGGVRIEN